MGFINKMIAKLTKTEEVEAEVEVGEWKTSWNHLARTTPNFGIVGYDEPYEVSHFKK